MGDKAKMICKICGKELQETARFCTFCGNKIEKVELKLTTKVEKKSGPNKRMIGFLALLFVVVAVVSAVIGIFFLAGRNINQTLNKFVKAYEKQDEYGMLKCMVPREYLDNAKSVISEEDVDIKSIFEEVCGKHLTGMKIVEEGTIDRDLNEDIEILLKKYDFSWNYDEMEIISLSDEQNEHDELQDTIKMVAYRVERKWYIVPGVMEGVTKKRQEEDIETASEIVEAVNGMLQNEEASELFDSSYRDVAISLESDLEYLPQKIREAIQAQMEKTPELRHTADGACGYAFKVRYDDVTEVYISSDTNMTEWQVYPQVDVEYYKGMKVDSSNKKFTEEYNYAKLLSEKSPLLGYWQGDKVGMYIGYSVSGGDEGFTIYLQSQDVGFQLIHRYQEYVGTGENGIIVFHMSNSYETLDAQISVLDEDRIELKIERRLSDAEYRYDNEDVLYTLKKGEISKKVFKQYEGTWIESGIDFGCVGDEEELFYCEECGCVHKRNYMDSEDEKYHTRPFVTMYDGKNMQTVFPEDNLYREGEGISYSMISYCVEGDVLQEEGALIGGGGSYDIQYYRDGTEDAEIAKVIKEYGIYVED